VKILIAYDGSNCAKDALKELHRAGLPADTHATVITVAEPWAAPVTSDGRKMDVSELLDQTVASKRAEEARALLSEYFPGWTVESEGGQGSPSHVIAERGGQLGVDLIVIGSHGLNALERFVFGSISQQVVTTAHRSVRVSRGNPHRDKEPIRLMIAFDGSEDANNAVDAVLSRVWPERTKVWVVTAVGSNFDEEANNEEREHFAELHARISERLKEHGLGAASIIDNTDPKHLILESAKELETDCIFVGSRGLTRFERTLIGSVSASISARANCSVEVVRK